MKMRAAARSAGEVKRTGIVYGPPLTIVRLRRAQTEGHRLVTFERFEASRVVSVEIDLERGGYVFLPRLIVDNLRSGVEEEVFLGLFGPASREPDPGYAASILSMRPRMEYEVGPVDLGADITGPAVLRMFIARSDPREEERLFGMGAGQVEMAVREHLFRNAHAPPASDLTWIMQAELTE